MAIAKKEAPKEVKPSLPPGELNDTVGKKYSTRLKGFKNQVFKDLKTGTRFNLETVTVAQVEAMLKAGSKDFTKREKGEAAEEAPAKKK